ncbi:RsmF rRNA methyltransferase first C-terminal domain-containing protein [Streptococcus gallolyticus]|uniref:RsmF rRNA methyltransferase first C-terminal domain-containing protein n=1 Tax=Streptococcus gallolyticus TaxID=315405 RepID=UPI00211C3BDC|nr:RsmB/NOP family class I SAM-dependent RNA methyltransferase [Streptococcus gallolyticus]MCQ9217169.1 RsmF rRNA methyltransferase first C-terminal domain-containing protein [Streptococcus gallolyticus]
MLLPEKFIEKYRNILGDEADDFLATFDQEAISGFRVNPLKNVQQTFDTPIPNTPWGHYGKVSGKSPEHVSGLVYSQEPAAQMVAQVVAPQENMRVLDLAAAPGGKSTHLLSYMNNTGVLVSNEISSKRSKVLVENIERFGARNVVVTNESSQKLAKVFKYYFDLIVFDGPCSGEGMFRKDPAATQYWHEDYPAECATLQKEILEEAMKMLAIGGTLVYSTCTWSPEENEGVVKWLLDKYDYLELVDIEKINGMVEGIDLPQVARMYPHHFKGEGQFVAKLRDTRTAEARSVKPVKSNLTKAQLKLWQDFAKQHIKVDLAGILQTFGDNLYLLPEGLPDLGKLKIVRNGLHLGTFKKNRFEPSFALGLSLSPDDVEQFVKIDIEQFKVYASGNIVKLEEPIQNGWYLVSINGNGIGFAKITGNILKNYFPKGLRFYS